MKYSDKAQPLALPEAPTGKNRFFVFQKATRMVSLPRNTYYVAFHCSCHFLLWAYIGLSALGKLSSKPFGSSFFIFHFLVDLHGGLGIMVGVIKISPLKFNSQRSNFFPKSNLDELP
jgi:hypothetical protein